MYSDTAGSVSLMLKGASGMAPLPIELQVIAADLDDATALGLSRLRQLAPASGLQVLHWGERLPWRQLPASQWPAAASYHLARRLFERALRKMYRLDRGMDFSPNQLVVLGAATSQAAP